MWIKLEKTDIDRYLIRLEDTVYSAFAKLFANKEKTLILVDTAFKVHGTITLGDFKRNVSYNLNTEVLQNSNLSLEEICNDSFFYKKNDEEITELCNHLLVPVMSGTTIEGVLRRGDPSKRIQFGNVCVGGNEPPVVIAEIGVNHDGDMSKARLLIDQAKLAKAHFVKFQHRSLKDTYIEFGHENVSELSTESTIDHLKKVNLSIEQLRELFDYARTVGILPLCTPFDLVALEEILSLSPVAIKIASADLLNFDLVEKAASTKLPIILSTGMHTEDEILTALNFARLHTMKIMILHCVSSYPAESSSLNLIYIQRLKELTGCIVGYSSHDNGNLASIASVSLGASVIEKHITWNREADGPDHNASSEFAEFKDLTRDIKEVHTSVGVLGINGKKLSQGEVINRANLSKSLYINKNIMAGEKIGVGDVVCMSPGIGIPCSSQKFILGMPALKNIKKNDPLYESDFFVRDLDWDRLEHIPVNSKWGIPVRFRDVNAVIDTISPAFVEFHLTYSDLEFEKFETLNINQCGVKVHTPELFKDNLILDLASIENSIRDRSIDYMKKTIEVSHKLFEKSAKNTSLDLVINPGGHSSNFFVDKTVRNRLFENLLTSFENIDFGLCNPLIQSMPPYPWHLGGRRYHNLFVQESDFFSWNQETSLGFCVDFSHSFLAAKFLNRPFFDYLETILPLSSYFHVADSEGTDGEGLQILDGEINFKDLFSKFLTDRNVEYIPEIWQGHTDSFQPFKTALSNLRYLGW